MVKQNNFIELELDDANAIDLSVWTFVGLRNGFYCFKRRVR